MSVYNTKNILVLGVADSIFTKNFCEQVLGQKKYNVVLLTEKYSLKYEQDYINCTVNQVEWPKLISQGIKKNLRWGNIKKYKDEILRLDTQMKFDEQVDVMFVHYVEPLHILYYLPLWKKAKNKILVFWGGDILGVSESKLKFMNFFLRDATKIVFMIQNQYEYFQKQFGHKYDNKVNIVDFGNSLLGTIDMVKKEYSKELCKERLGMDKQRIAVHIGYNASREQQHVKMMKSIVQWLKLSSNKGWINKLEFVYHMPYGKDDTYESYINQIKELMAEIPLKYILIEDFLYSEDLAMFRRSCDIFLYGQKTDARSASPLEYVYAGARFICPIWLWDNYDILEKDNIQCYTYNDFDELSDVFEKCLNQYDSNSDINYEQREKIKNAISWESLVPKWRSLYE